MGLTNLVVAALALRYVNALAFTQQVCLTQYTSVSGLAVSTTTIARTISIPNKVVVTVTPSTVVTPPATTTTTTTTVTSTSTLPVETDTFTETSTQTVPSTATDTTTVATNTITTTTSTLAATVSTVPVPNGFRYPNPTPGAPQKRAVEVVRRQSIVERAPNGNKSPHCAGAPKKYPFLVKCYQLVEEVVQTTSTKTATTTTTITFPTPTEEATATETDTETTSLPNASTTTTTTTTTTSVTTTTQTETTTLTQTATATSTPPPSSTVYAACLPSNTVERDSNGRLLELEAAYVPSQLSFTANAYDCCVACFKTPNCFGANYGAGFGQQSCELEVGSSCPANQAGVGGLYSYQRAGNIPVIVSNGPCGRYTYAENF